MKNKILSIQSKVVYGYVGNNIAELAIQLHGFDVIAYPTVYLSAHTGHQPIHGTKVSKALFDDLIVGVQDLEINNTICNIITGYIGSLDIMLSAADYISSIKREYPNLLYICDPVMGDIGGLYVDEEVAKSYLEDIIPICDIITPNHFEFEYIIGHQARSERAILEAVVQNEILNQKTVIVTSCHLTETNEDEIDTLVIKDGMCQRLSAKWVDINTTGTGDLFTAIVACKLAKGVDIISAVGDAMQLIKEALKYTVNEGNVELNAASLLYTIK